MSIDGRTDDWVSHTCTLPTEDRPLRVAEFDALFASALIEVERVAPDTLRLVLEAGIEAEARTLTARETECCTFFSFTFERGTHERLFMDVSVPDSQVGVLDALALRAQAGQVR